MAWTIKFTELAEKELARLDKEAQRQIKRYLVDRLMPAADPTVFAKPLRHDLAGLWRFRVRDYRIVCSIQEDQILVLVLSVGHRKDVYEM